MRLSLSTLAYKLSPALGAKLRNPSQDKTLYERPVLYEPGMPFERDVLYIARANALPEVPPTCHCAIICVGSTPPWQRRGRHIPVLHVVCEPNLAMAFNAIQDVYRTCESWDASLRDEIEKGLDFDIRRVLAIASEFLQRPISVVDQDLLSILSTTLVPGPRGNLVAVVSNEARPLTTEINEQIKEVCRIERLLREPYFSALEATGKSYCNNLYPLGHFAGCVSITEGDVPFDDGEIPLIDHFFEIFQKAFLRHLQNYGSNEQSGLVALQHAFAHVPLSRHETELLSLEPDEQWCCISLRESRGSRSLPEDYMHATLSGIFPKTVYAIVFEHAVVGVVRTVKTTSLGIDPHFDAIGTEIGRMGYFGGVSNPFSNLAELDMHLVQADFAADHNADGTKSLYFFHDYALSYLLDACSSEMPVDALMGQGLKNLIAYDKARGTEHVHTLDVYLHNECSVSRTARELFVHRSSLLKRLERIRLILEDNLDDARHRLYYRLCLALIKRDSQRL